MEPSLKKVKTDKVQVQDQLNNWESTKLHPLLIDQVIDIVFAEFSLNDLKNSRKVCKFWNAKAVDEILKRDTKIVIGDDFYGEQFLGRFDKSQDKKLFTKNGTIIFKSIPAISYITAKGFLNDEEITIKNMVFNFNRPSNQNYDHFHAIFYSDKLTKMDFDQFFHQLSKYSKHLKSLTFTAPKRFSDYNELTSYYKLIDKDSKEVIILSEIEENIKKWSDVQIPKLESLTISCGFSQFILSNDPTIFVNFFKQKPKKLSTLDLGFDAFPSIFDPHFNHMLIPIGPQLTNLTITINKQVRPGFAQALCDLAQGGMQLKKLSLSVLYEFDGHEPIHDELFPPYHCNEGLVDQALDLVEELEEANKNAQIRQEIVLFNAFFQSQKDSIEVLKINLERVDDLDEFLENKIILPVFLYVTSLVLFHRREDYEFDQSWKSKCGNLLGRINLSTKFPNLEKISFDSQTIGYHLIKHTADHVFMKTLEYTFTKQEIFPSKYLRAVFSRVENLVIKYPPNSKCIYYLHPNVNGSHIPWKKSLQSLEINYPLYDLEQFDFNSLKSHKALKKLKFICIPTDIVRSKKPYTPNLAPLKTLSLTSIIFQNYMIPRDHESKISELLPQFQCL